jgi:hypothetical protein
MGLTRPQAEWWPANTWVRLGPKSEAMIGRQGFMWVKCAKTAHTFTAQPRPAEDAPKEALAALAALAARPEEAGGEGPLSPTARREELVGEMKVLAAFAALPARTKADRPEQLLAAMNKKIPAGTEEAEDPTAHPTAHPYGGWTPDEAEDSQMPE